MAVSLDALFADTDVAVNGFGDLTLPFLNMGEKELIKIVTIVS